MVPGKVWSVFGFLRKIKNNHISNDKKGKIMNANVRRAMELATLIADKQTSIEQLKAQLDEYQEELEDLVGATPKSSRKKPRSSSASTKPSRSKSSSRVDFYGKGGVWRHHIMSVLEGGEIFRARQIVDRLKIDPHKIGVVSAELSRMYKMGVIKRLEKGLYQNVGNKGASKKRYTTSRTGMGEGGFVQPLILEALADGNKKTAQQIRDALKQPLKRNTLYSGLSKLCKSGKVTRVDTGIYRIAKAKPRTKDLPPSNKKPVAISKMKKEGTTLPRGYWKPAILKAMKPGVKMRCKEIFDKIDVSPDKRSAANVAIHTLAQKGVLKKIDKGIYMLPDKKKAEDKKQPAKTETSRVQKAIKNFKVKKLTRAQENYLERLQPDSVSAKLLKVMKHGKEYTIAQLITRIDPNMNAKTMRTALGRLQILKFLKRPQIGIYVRV